VGHHTKVCQNETKVLWPEFSLSRYLYEPAGINKNRVQAGGTRNISEVTLMSSTQVESAASKSASKPFQERRRRKRAKISAQVHIKGGAGSAESFEEVCMSVDVSRDGLLFMTSRKTYLKGQRLHITFPYSAAAAAINTAQVATVVRTADMAGGKHGIAVEFKDQAAKGDSEAPGIGAGSTATGQPIVLAVEPDARMADIMRNLLQQDGYSVITVATANEALEILRTTIPAVFLAEVEAEDMSGHDLCLIIKRNERLQRVPVILLTRSAQPADYSASHSLGAVVCMAKPFKPERLQHVVRLVAPPPRIGSSSYGARFSSSHIERAL
jgi:CheY-like chemotaxis protein